jgi:hypothetical protein
VLLVGLDPDVAIAAFERVRDTLPAADRSGVDRLLDDLRELQAAANEALAEAVERARDAGLHERLLALAAEAQPV